MEFRGIAPIPALVSERVLSSQPTNNLSALLWKPGKEGLKDFFWIATFDSYYEPPGTERNGVYGYTAFVSETWVRAA